MGIYIIREAMNLIERAKKQRKEDQLKKLILSKPAFQPGQHAYVVPQPKPEGKKY